MNIRFSTAYADRFLGELKSYLSPHHPSLVVYKPCQWSELSQKVGCEKCKEYISFRIWLKEKQFMTFLSKGRCKRRGCLVFVKAYKVWRNSGAECNNYSSMTCVGSGDGVKASFAWQTGRLAGVRSTKMGGTIANWITCNLQIL